MLQNDTATIWPRRQDRTRCEPVSMAETTQAADPTTAELPEYVVRTPRTSHDTEFGRTGYTSRDLPGVRGAGGLISW